jgi:hypothetical protein
MPPKCGYMRHRRRPIDGRDGCPPRRTRADSRGSALRSPRRCLERFRTLENGIAVEGLLAVSLPRRATNQVPIGCEHWRCGHCRCCPFQAGRGTNLCDRKPGRPGQIMNSPRRWGGHALRRRNAGRGARSRDSASAFRRSTGSPSTGTGTRSGTSSTIPPDGPLPELRRVGRTEVSLVF